LEAVKAEAMRLGANKVLLSVAMNNIAGQNFFEGLGFRTTMLEMMLEIENSNG
jgi:ribosomal protein S18 acetylase RimI-like enzyme